MIGDIIELRDSRRKHFFTVDNEIFDMNLSVYALAVYFYLCRCAGDKSYAFPSLSTLQKALSISKDRLLKSLKELEKKNIIRRERRTGEKGNYQSTVYMLLDKSVWEKGSLSYERGVVRQTDKGRSPGGQRVVRQTDKGCPSDGHKEKLTKNTQIEEKTKEERVYTPPAKEKAQPKNFVKELQRLCAEGKMDFPQRVISNFTKGEDENCQNSEFQITEKDNSLTETTTENTTKTTSNRESMHRSPAEEKAQPKNLETLEESEQGGGEFAVVKSSSEKSANKTHSKFISPYAKRIIEAFKQAYMEKFSCPPAIYPKAVEKLEEQLGYLNLGAEKAAFVDKAIEVIEDYLNSDDYFVKHKVNYSFSGFVSQLPKLISAKKEKDIKKEPKRIDIGMDGVEWYEGI